MTATTTPMTRRTAPVLSTVTIRESASVSVPEILLVCNYTYVSDIVDATIKATDYLNNNDKVYEIFNVASSNPKTINEMVTTIEKVLNKKAKIKYEDKPIGDVNKTFGNIIKAKKLLNWKPSVSFEDGIRSFIDWYKDNEK